MLKYNLKDLTKAYENGIVNKAYQGLTKGGYQWVDIDSFESITLQEQLTCCGLRFSVDDYMNAEYKPRWHIGEICEIDGQRKYGNFRIENDELVLILGREMGEYCGEDEEGRPTYLELGRWHRGETVELRSDTLTVRWEMNIETMYSIPWQCYIDRKGTGRIVYQRVRTPMYRKTSGETYCVGFDKMVEEYSQVSFDDGQTWTTTATTEVLVEHNSEDCGYQKPSIKSVSATHFTYTVDEDGNLKHIHSIANSEGELASRCYIQVKGITSITFKITVSVDSSGLRFYSSKDNYQTGTTVKIVGRTWTLGDLDPTQTYGIQVQLIHRDAQYITGTNCGADITYTTLE